MSDDNPYRHLPGVDTLASSLPRYDLEAPQSLKLEAARQAISKARESIGAGAPMKSADIQALASQWLDDILRPSLRHVINATGVVIHTNLGRAPLSLEALASASRYCTLEYDLTTGARGGRREHAARLLRHLTGAQAALVVNNNAAAVVLMLAAVAKGGEVIISRGELVEIGGSFRVPEIMEASGATLVEVGTTNKTHPRDYANAVTERTRAILKVHPSNYRVVGFTRQTRTEELAEIARDHELPLLYDWGTGTFAPLPSPLEAVDLGAELRAGVDLLTFSGDKLLGGPQAGLLIGSEALIGACARHPLARALRADKLTLAGLEHTLMAYVREQPMTIPTYEMLHATEAELKIRAQRLVERLTAEINFELAGFSAERCEDAVGGGSHPGRTLPGAAIRVDLGSDAAKLAAKLRTTSPPVIGTVTDRSMRLHLRTVGLREEDGLVRALGEAFSSLTP